MMGSDLQRHDGRSHMDHREVRVKLGELQRVDGSARFEFGNTSALASISGPIEVRLAVEQASKATFEVFVRPLVGVAGTESKLLATYLKEILTPTILLSHNPRSLIQLTIQSCSTMTSPSTSVRLHPSSIAAMINAASFALLNASSCPMSGVVCASSVGRVIKHSSNLERRHTLIVDPDEEELKNLDGGGAFAFFFAGESKIRMVWSSWNAAPFSEEEFVEARELAKKSAGLILGNMKDIIADRVNYISQNSMLKKAEERMRDVETLGGNKMEI